LTQEKIIKHLFPELVSKDENRKTFIDKYKLDTRFLVNIECRCIERIGQNNQEEEKI
jgi:hypothetical protein